MAYNIPFQLWTGQRDEKRKTYLLADNPNFLVRVRKKFQPQDTILLLCSSGGRSAKAANRLAADVLKDVYNIVKDYGSDRGGGLPAGNNSWELLKNCWLDSGAPWSFELDSRVFYFIKKTIRQPFDPYIFGTPDFCPLSFQLSAFSCQL